MEYNSAIKNKTILSFATVWMNLDNIMLSEISSQRKTNTMWDPYVESSEQNKLMNKTGPEAWIHGTD